MVAKQDTDGRPDDRVHYFRREQGVWKCVIYEVDADGKEDFREQESGEVRWYPFEPSQWERCTARELFQRASGRLAWEIRVDADAKTAC